MERWTTEMSPSLCQELERQQHSTEASAPNPSFFCLKSKVTAKPNSTAINGSWHTWLGLQESQDHCLVFFQLCWITRAKDVFCSWLIPSQKRKSQNYYYLFLKRSFHQEIQQSRKRSIQRFFQLYSNPRKKNPHLVGSKKQQLHPLPKGDLWPLLVQSCTNTHTEFLGFLVRTPQPAQG